MAKAKKLSPSREEYNKQYKRIYNFVRRAQKRGFQFNQEVEEILAKRNPKRATKKMASALAYLTPDRLYAKAKVTLETGEKVSGTRYREMERSAAAKKASETRKANKQSAMSLYASNEPIIHEREKSSEVPETSPGVVKTPGLTVYYNIVEPYIKQIGLPLPKYWKDKKGQIRRYSGEYLQEREGLQSTLLGIIEEAIAKVGKAGLGLIFMREQQELSRQFDFAIYGYDLNKINTAVSKIAGIIRKGVGGSLSNDELGELSDEGDSYEGYEEY